MVITNIDNNVVSTYTGTTLTVKVPLDEITAELLSPWNLTVGGLAQHSFTGLTGDANFLIFSDTVDFYLNTVDVNAEYFSRTYLVQTKGGATTETLQPYLLNTADGSQITIQTQSGIREPLANIRIVISKNIGGSVVEVQSMLSDVTGSALASLRAGDVYLISFFSGTTLLDSTDNFVPTVTPTFFYFNLTTGLIIDQPANPVSVVFDPATGAILITIIPITIIVIKIAPIVDHGQGNQMSVVHPKLVLELAKSCLMSIAEIASV